MYCGRSLVCVMYFEESGVYVVMCNYRVIAKARDNIISEEIKSTHLESERDVHTVTSAIKDIVKTKAAVQKPNAQRVTITFQDNAAYPQSQVGTFVGVCGGSTICSECIFLILLTMVGHHTVYNKHGYVAVTGTYVH